LAPDIHYGDVVHGDQLNQRGSHNIGKIVGFAAGKRTVLVLMSNPRGTERLGVDEEYRAIERAIAASRYRERLDVRPGLAVRHDDLQDLLLAHEPTVVHYSGHNSAEAGIMLADERGNVRPVAPDALSGLFAIEAGSIRCVVLNACVTADQAMAIAAHVPCAIGMSRPVPDSAAITFSSAFYRAAAHGRSVGVAFRLACNRLGFEDGGTYRDLTPAGGRPAAQRAIPVLLNGLGDASRTFITT
jgi:CHAT domain